MDSCLEGSVRAGALAGLTVASGAAAQTDAVKSVRAVRVETPPTIDGALDEAVWQQAEPITDFHQVRPGDGDEPSERTEVYLLYDDDALYVGARLGDSEPEQIAANTLRHGQPLGRTDDRLVVMLDPFNSKRSGFRFETNANGVRHEMLYQNVSQLNVDWATIWEAAGSIDDNGWLAEMAIPFKSLAFDPESDTWGFNFARGIRRRGEEMVWVSRNRSFNPSIAGVMTGLEGMDQGIGLDVVPSLAVTEQKLYASGGSSSETNPSLNIYYRLTPSLNGSLTFNTDFSATEVDDRQVNLTRFGLFFPERRDFFLNDSDLFDFGRIGGGRGPNSNFNQAWSGADRRSGLPFFSRRIGLSEDGTPVDLDYGGKISGRIGRWNIGTLAIRQDAYGDVDATDLFVSRISANVLAESAVGFIATNGDPRSDLDNSVVGLDFRYLNTRLPGGRVFEGDLWYQRSDTEGVDGDDAAYGFRLRSPNNAGVRAGFGYKELQANFNPALGYVNRAGVRDMIADVGYTRYLNSNYWQRVFTGVDVERINLIESGDLQSQVIRARVFELDTNSSDNVEYHFLASKENVNEAFTLYEDPTRAVGVAPGEYSFGEHILSFEAGSHRRLFGELDLQWGDFYGGERDRIVGSVSWRQSNNFIVSMSYDWNDITLPEGQFISRLVGLTTEVIFSSELSWISLIQYDNISEEMGINSRLIWIPRAGREGFIVLNHGLQDFDKDNTFNSAFADLSLKFNYTYRF